MCKKPLRRKSFASVAVIKGRLRLNPILAQAWDGQAANRSFFYHCFDEPRRIGAEFAHDLVVIGLFDGHRLEPILR